MSLLDAAVYVDCPLPFSDQHQGEAFVRMIRRHSHSTRHQVIGTDGNRTVLSIQSNSDS